MQGGAIPDTRMRRLTGQPNKTMITITMCQILCLTLYIKSSINPPSTVMS